MPKPGDVRGDGFIFSNGKWRNPQYRAQLRRYRKVNMSYPCGRATQPSGGKAAELMVEADLLNRGLLVTRPSNPDVPDDLHFFCDGAWWSVQVKAVGINLRTGTTRWGPSRENKITSDIVALVIGEARRIEYRPHRKPSLPTGLV